MSKLIDTTALSHFFERLKGVFWQKGEADEVYALKHGSNDSYFSASNFSVGTSDGTVNMERYFDTVTSTAFLKLSAGSAVTHIPVLGTDSRVWTSSNFDPDLKVDCVKIVTNPALGAAGVSRFALQSPVGVFSVFSENNQNSNKVVFVLPVQQSAAGVNQFGFYLSKGGNLYYICQPTANALYYNETAGELCRWSGNAFTKITVSISGGSVVIDGETYDVASDADIDSLIDNILSD